MSWDKLFKSHGSIKTSVLSKSEDREFVREAKRLESLDDATKQLYRESKQLGEAELGVWRAEQKLVSDLALTLPSHDDAITRQGTQDWVEAVKLHEESANQLANNAQKVLVDPMKRLNSMFPTLQTAIKKRDQLLAEYHKWQLKCDKYSKKERTGPIAVKLDGIDADWFISEVYIDSRTSYVLHCLDLFLDDVNNQFVASKKSFSVAKEEFDAYNKLLQQEMPQLYNGRSQYVMPCLQALLNLQLAHYGQCYKNYTELLHKLDPTPGASMPPTPGRDSSTAANSSNADRFNELCNLSIVTSQ